MSKRPSKRATDKSKANNQPPSDGEASGPAGEGVVVSPSNDTVLPTSPAGPPTATKYQRSEPRTILRSQITSADYNPRVLTPAGRRKLKHLIKKHGLVGGIVWNQRSGVLVGGHQRLTILDDLEGGRDYSITVDVVDLDPVEERQLNVALNNFEAQGQFDFDLLASVVGEVLEAGGKPEDMGHDAASLHEMFGDSFFSQHLADQEDAEAPIVGILEEIKDAGREAKGIAAASGGGEPSPRQRDVRLSRAGSDDLAEFEEEVGDGQDGGESDGAEQSIPPPAGQPAPTTTKEALAARRKEYAASYAETNETDTVLTLVFETNATLLAFMKWLKLNPQKRAFDYRDIVESIQAAITTGKAHG